ncbi:hypothetical protein MKW98_001764 [Papaver atlanticum]|uniref:Uncharacterized protein n=1 Tax=Papaver atlanticum TaxID=357466 RepID=A0AAD4X8J8_9MAGN|nr:hypothetical protein MKW98_001764 [Papaver atlanticum]
MERRIHKKKGNRRNNKEAFVKAAESVVEYSNTTQAYGSLTQGSESVADHSYTPVDIIFRLSDIHPKATMLSGNQRKNEYQNSNLNSNGGADSDKKKNSLKDAHMPIIRETTIPDDGWVIEINNYGEGGDYDSGKSWTIFRIPRNMSEISKNAYTPKLKRYLLRLLGYTDATEHPSPVNLVFDDFDGYIDAGSSSFTRRKHVGLGTLMMVMDGCFVIELIRLHHKYLINQKDVDDPIFTTRWMLCTLRRDLLMLENQLPFHVLEELFNLTRRPGLEPDVPLVDLILHFFNPLLRRDLKNLQVNREKNYNHMLDVFRTSFLPIPVIGPVEDPTEMKNTLSTHSATELQEAGIKFSNKSQLEVSDLLSVHFDRSTGTLNIPSLQIDDTTVPLFLKFMAYEQCDREAEPYFTNHFMFLDRLVNTAKDIEILHNYGVVNHALGSDKDVANLINKLSREIIYDADTCHLRKHMGELKRDHFSSPWKVASLVAAIILLILTFCQTFFSFYGYFKPPK